jgi:hypothetical protein
VRRRRAATRDRHLAGDEQVARVHRRPAACEAVTSPRRSATRPVWSPAARRQAGEQRREERRRIERADAAVDPEIEAIGIGGRLQGCGDRRDPPRQRRAPTAPSSDSTTASVTVAISRPARADREADADLVPARCARQRMLATLRHAMRGPGRRRPSPRRSGRRPDRSTGDARRWSAAAVRRSAFVDGAPEPRQQRQVRPRLIDVLLASRPREQPAIRAAVEPTYGRRQHRRASRQVLSATGTTRTTSEAESAPAVERAGAPTVVSRLLQCELLTASGDDPARAPNGAATP